MRQLVKRIGLLCLVLAVLVVPVAAQTAIVSIGTVEVAPDSNATLPIIISGVTNLGSGTIDVSYDPAVVHVIGVTDGTGNALQVQSWHAEEGIVRIVAWDAASPHSGTVIFANVTLNAVGETAQESPLNITVRDLENYFKYTQISRSVTNGTFTIRQAEGPTPTPAQGGGGGGGSYYYVSPTPTPPATIVPPPVTNEVAPPSGTPTATATPTLTPSPAPTQPTAAPTASPAPEAPLVVAQNLLKLMIIPIVSIAVTVVLIFLALRRRDRPPRTE